MNIDWDNFFTMIVYGCPASGKTHLIKYLAYYGAVKRKYDHCILFSSTNQTSNYDFIPKQYKYEAYDQAMVEKYVNFCKKHNEKKITTRGLIIFDDVCGATVFKTPFFYDLFTTYRHWGINVIVSMQIPLEFPPALRPIIRYACIYKYINFDEIDKIYTNFGSMAENRKDFLRIYDQHTNERFKFLFYNQVNVYDKSNCYSGARAPSKIPMFKLKY